MKFRVAADMRADCIHRDPQRPGNLRRGFPLQSHSVDSFHVLFFHLDNSSFEFAVLCVKPRAVVPNDGAFFTAHQREGRVFE